jgi:DNA segregation ATPase FtsK/SpoIIIE, S-DNA-T family
MHTMDNTQLQKTTDLLHFSHKKTWFNKQYLKVIGSVGPVLAQLGIIALLLFQRNWFYVIVLAPSIVANIAMCINNFFEQAQPTIAQDHRKTQQHRDTFNGFSYQATTHDCNFDLKALPSLRLDQIIAGHEAVDSGGFLWQGIVHNWLICNGSCNSQSIDEKFYSAVLGSTIDGNFCLNILKQGPHALVAGTTGSGKSVFLQDWCLYLACKLPPNLLNFIFLDFKGGAAFNQLSRLPHCVGSVSDLNLQTAARAIRSIELELKHREQLIAEHGATSIDQLKHPPARLLVIVDEFNALRQQLPDYMEHLVQLSSLGRSLGMNLIACTQNPIGQVSAQMKANMNLNISLRVRDALQSQELLGSNIAATISPRTPGIGFYCDGDEIQGFRCASCNNLDNIVEQVLLANRFCQEPTIPTLFTSPLPKVLCAPRSENTKTLTHWNQKTAYVYLGKMDDGVRHHDCMLPIVGNVAIIGGSRRGKSTLIELIHSQLLSIITKPHSSQGEICLIVGHYNNDHPNEQIFYFDRNGHINNNHALEHDSRSSDNTPRSPMLTFWLLDDGDELLDPFNNNSTAQRLRKALRNTQIQVIVCTQSARKIREPELFPTQIVFPSGQRSEDLMAGISTSILQTFDTNDASIPGRAILIRNGHNSLLQCSCNEIS